MCMCLHCVNCGFVIVGVELGLVLGPMNDLLNLHSSFYEKQFILKGSYAENISPLDKFN